MFISVVLPAPFSPRSACTSPRWTSKPTWSFARTPGNRFVIPRTSRIGRSSTDDDFRRAGPRARPSSSMRNVLLRPRNLDLARDDLPLQRVHLGDVRLRHLRADLAEPEAAVLERERHVRPALELAVLRRTDDADHPQVDPLHCAREDVRPEVRLVDIDADAPDLLLLRRLQRAEAARPGDVEDDFRARGDLVQRERLALVLLRERPRVVDVDLDVLDALLRARRIAGEEVLHRRDRLAADAADDVAACLLRHQRGETADEVAVLLHAELRPHDVRRLAPVERHALDVVVGDGEL